MTNKLNMQDLKKVSGGVKKYKDYYDRVWLIHNDFAVSMAAHDVPERSEAINYFVDGANKLSAGYLSDAIEKLTKAYKKMSSLKYSFSDARAVIEECCNKLDSLIKELQDLLYK